MKYTINYEKNGVYQAIGVNAQTAQFVTIQERGDRERRCKINVCNGVENIHPDSLIGYYANEVLPTEEEREEQRKQEEEEREERERRQLEAAKTEAVEIATIIEKFPHEDGRPSVRVCLYNEKGRGWGPVFFKGGVRQLRTKLGVSDACKYIKAHRPSKKR